MNEFEDVNADVSLVPEAGESERDMSEDPEEAPETEPLAAGDDGRTGQVDAPATPA